MRVSLGLSFDDEDSFKEAIESLRFNDNLPSDPNTLQQMGRSLSSMPLQDSEWNEDDITPSDPNILRRVESSSSIQAIRRCGDIQKL